jgi:hypothetical protein
MAMIIHYCGKCGILMSSEPQGGVQTLCPDCRTGHIRESKYLRDSDMIPNRLRFRRMFMKQFAPAPTQS